MKNFGHDDEFDESKISTIDLKDKIEQGIVFYNHFADKTSTDKWNYNYKLKKIEDELLPNYLIQNKVNFIKWFK